MHSNAEQTKQYPGVIGVEVRTCGERSIIGIEMFVDQKRVRPEVEIPRLWRQLLERTEGVQQLSPTSGKIGLYAYEPPFGPGQEFVYTAGFEVDGRTDALPDGMLVKQIPGGEAAVVRFRGKPAEYGQAWDYLHQVWYPSQQTYDVVDDYEFERLADAFAGEEEVAAVFELHFPLKRRA
ncbi:GyrI-like domain-containing protein [Paenibacillus aurantiacus]|uniref:GyrI-like domain-containing protein n=1 Tax=Paenibacillus aurantiacus TaxID=1936118 RepID=A0ABV5KLG1_9BACL